MKVGEVNADLINFYLKQGHRFTKTLGRSSGEKIRAACLFTFSDKGRRHFFMFIVFVLVFLHFTVVFILIVVKTVLPYQF